MRVEGVATFAMRGRNALEIVEKALHFPSNGNQIKAHPASAVEETATSVDRDDASAGGAQEGQSLRRLESRRLLVSSYELASVRLHARMASSKRNVFVCVRLMVPSSSSRATCSPALVCNVVQ